MVGVNRALQILLCLCTVAADPRLQPTFPAQQPLRSMQAEPDALLWTELH